MSEMVTLPREVVERALFALEAAADDEGSYRIYKDALDDLRAALAAGEARPEPVAYTSTAQLAALDNGYQHSITAICPRYATMRDDMVPLYAAPPQPAEPSEEQVEAAWQVLFGTTLNAEEGKRVRAALVAAMGVRK